MTGDGAGVAAVVDMVLFYYHCFDYWAVGDDGWAATAAAAGENMRGTDD